MGTAFDTNRCSSLGTSSFAFARVVAYRTGCEVTCIWTTTRKGTYLRSVDCVARLVTKAGIMADLALRTVAWVRVESICKAFVVTASVSDNHVALTACKALVATVVSYATNSILTSVPIVCVVHGVVRVVVVIAVKAGSVSHTQESIACLFVGAPARVWTTAAFGSDIDVRHELICAVIAKAYVVATSTARSITPTAVVSNVAVFS